MTSEGSWYNDLSRETFAPGQHLPSLPEPGEVEYVEAFTQGSMGWRSIQWRDGASDADTEWNSDGYVRIAGPWWPDTNQDRGADGQRVLNVVAYLLSSRLKPHVHFHQIDFRNAVVTIRLRGEGVVLRGANLVFWVQAKPVGGTHAVNFALTGQPLGEAIGREGWTTVKLTLDRQGDWTCLGAHPNLEDRYGCAPIEDVLADVNADFGLLFYPVRVSPGVTDVGEWPAGTILIDEIRIRYRLTPRPQERTD